MKKENMDLVNSEFIPVIFLPTPFFQFYYHNLHSNVSLHEISKNADMLCQLGHFKIDIWSCFV